MSIAEQSGIHEGNRQHYQRFLEQWPWEWAATLRTGKRDHANLLYLLRTEILRREGGQLGTMGVAVNDSRGCKGRHIHLLMLGRFEDGRTLRNLDKERYAVYYGMVTRLGAKGAVIDEVRDLRAAMSYIIAPRNTPPWKHELLVPWGRILEKTKTVRKGERHIVK